MHSASRKELGARDIYSVYGKALFSFQKSAGLLVILPMLIVVSNAVVSAAYAQDAEDVIVEMLYQSTVNAETFEESEIFLHAPNPREVVECIISTQKIYSAQAEISSQRCRLIYGQNQAAVSACMAASGPPALITLWTSTFILFLASREHDATPVEWSETGYGRWSLESKRRTCNLLGCDYWYQKGREMAEGIRSMIHCPD